MRNLALSTVACVLLTATPALAATSAGYQGDDTTCPIYHPFEAVTGSNSIDQPVVHCALHEEGVASVASCDAGGCGVMATGSAATAWDPLGYGYTQSAVVNYKTNTSQAICNAVGALPSSGVACTGTSLPQRFDVVAGACTQVAVSTGTVIDYVTTPAPLPYMAVYLAVRVDHEFALCRDARGTPSLTLVQ
jgi:hypothetical protein